MAETVAAHYSNFMEVIEIPYGKAREYENGKAFYPMHINALRKYICEKLK
jgi:hypothetical protein